MADLKAVRDAIADVLSTVDGLRGLNTIPGEITPPAALVLLESIDFDTTMTRGSDDYQFVAMVVVSKAHERVAQDALFGYLAGAGQRSVKAAFEADPTLGGLVHDAAVTEVRPPGNTTIGEIGYYGVPIVITVMASGL